jgi:zinc D-Ala-D-Ala carboxypeptidase
MENIKLSDNFTLPELTKSAIAARVGIKNEPQAAAIECLKVVCIGILEPVRKHFKIPYSPSSAFRSSELNAYIGSNSTSQHCKGEAVDIELPGIANADLAVWIAKTLPFDQLILEHYQIGVPNSGWVHVSLKTYGNRQQALTFDGHKYMPGIFSNPKS